MTPPKPDSMKSFFVRAMVIPKLKKYIIEEKTKKAASGEKIKAEDVLRSFLWSNPKYEAMIYKSTYTHEKLLQSVREAL